MLVLSRHLNESIIIDGQVRVIVVSITPGRIELGIEAPRHILVDREELYQRKLTEGRNPGNRAPRRRSRQAVRFKPDTQQRNSW